MQKYICISNAYHNNNNFWRFQVSASGESMYDDAYTLQLVEKIDVMNLNFVAGMVPFLFNLIQDVCVTNARKN